MKPTATQNTITSELGDYSWLCETMGISYATARRWVMEKRIPYIKLAHGSLVRFNKRVILEDWVKAGTIEAAK